MLARAMCVLLVAVTVMPSGSTPVHAMKTRNNLLKKNWSTDHIIGQQNAIVVERAALVSRRHRKVKEHWDNSEVKPSYDLTFGTAANSYMISLAAVFTFLVAKHDDRVSQTWLKEIAIHKEHQYYKLSIMDRELWPRDNICGGESKSWPTSVPDDNDWRRYFVAIPDLEHFLGNLPTGVSTLKSIKDLKKWLTGLQDEKWYPKNSDWEKQQSQACETIWFTHRYDFRG